MSAGDSKAGTDAVTELQRQAISALNREKPQQSIDYLERAIKIAPRDALNWHYLAKSYYQQGNQKKCLAMIERSMSYSRDDDDIDQANLALSRKCRVD